MKSFYHSLSNLIHSAVENCFGKKCDISLISIQKTRKDFEGDFTLVVFPLLKISGLNPEQTADALGKFLTKDLSSFSKFNVVKGFLNLSLSDNQWYDFLKNADLDSSFGFNKIATGRKILLEYSSPNTNKPLHLGHVRNNLLGFSVAEILKANGDEVIRTNLVNDRGVHICKSMLAWQLWGNNETPESSGLKGDHLVGKYYVEFDKHLKEEIKQKIDKGLSKEDAEKNSELLFQIQEMLRKWEAGDKEVIALWEKMNSWVYNGFDLTYKNLGVSFDKIYYESQTYLYGKDLVEDGLAKGVFYKKDDQSVWIDLTQDGLDHKLVRRSDGTSVYITQDLGTAVQRMKDFGSLHGMIYTVGNEQDYHFKVLFLILDKLGYSWAKNCYHLSYGMVELPEGKMKSREGTVVDADDLIEEMINTAEATTRELGKIEDFTSEEAKKLYRNLGLGALKYFILKVDPRKKMLFDPKESVDFNGNTGPFIQYTYARICSLERKSKEFDSVNFSIQEFHPAERELLRILHDFSTTISDAAKSFSPALIANYAYELAKTFNQFYHDCKILKEESEDKRSLRIRISALTGRVLKSSMGLLGIEVPEKM